jgi:hypothetical protein
LVVGPLKSIFPKFFYLFSHSKLTQKAILKTP